MQRMIISVFSIDEQFRFLFLNNKYRDSLFFNEFNYFQQFLLFAD